MPRKTPKGGLEEGLTINAQIAMKFRNACGQGEFSDAKPRIATLQAAQRSISTVTPLSERTFVCQ